MIRVSTSGSWWGRLFDVHDPLFVSLVSPVSSRVPVDLSSFGVRSGVGVWFFSTNVGERFCFLGQVLQRGRLMLGPPLAKCTVDLLVDTPKEEPLEHHFGLQRRAPQRFRL